MTMVSIRDIAEIAKTSPTAVSLILNKRPHRYAQATVERVEAAAQEHNYIPSVYAQTMRTKRFNNVTLFKSAQHGHSAFDPIAERCFHDALAGHGIRMGIALIDDELTKAKNAITTIRRQWQCDGFAFSYNFPGPAALVKQLKASPFPVVWYNQNYRYDAVYPDNAGGAANLTRAMLEAGHKKVAYVCSATHDGRKQHFSVGDREAGYSKAMLAAGLKPRTLELQSFTADGQMEEFLAFLEKKKNLPTGLVFYSSASAKAFATAAILKGYSIPRDFSVGTFGIAYDVWNTGLRLQYAIEYFDVMGTELGNMLARRIEQPDSPIKSVKVPMDLREGCESIAPPRKKR